jgi:hypothetical protein
VECQRDEDVRCQRPAVRADAKSADDDRQDEVDEVEVQDEWHASVVGEPDFAELMKDGNPCDADDGDDHPYDKAEEDRADDDFRRVGDGRREPREKSEEVIKIKS